MNDIRRQVTALRDRLDANSGTAPQGETTEEWAERLTDENFNRLIDELLLHSPTPHLPADFSRADIYSDHN